jgi:hypothetical protein
MVESKQELPCALKAIDLMGRTFEVFGTDV